MNVHCKIFWVFAWEERQIFFPIEIWENFHYFYHLVIFGDEIFVFVVFLRWNWETWGSLKKESIDATESWLFNIWKWAVKHFWEDNSYAPDVYGLVIMLLGQTNLGSSIPPSHDLTGHFSCRFASLFLLVVEVFGHPWLSVGQLADALLVILSFFLHISFWSHCSR